jgi:hypothetical protein
MNTSRLIDLQMMEILTDMVHLYSDVLQNLMDALAELSNELLEKSKELQKLKAVRDEQNRHQSTH